MLWNNSHETWAEFLTRCEAQWRNQAGLSKEAAADEIAKIYVAHGGFEKSAHNVTPMSATEQHRMKATEVAVTRAKEKDMFEMAPYVTAAWSDEVKLTYWSQYLRTTGLTVHLAESEEEGGFGIEAACELQLHIGNTFNAVFDAAKSQAPDSLDKADRQIVQAITHFKKTRKLIAGARTLGAKVKSVIHRATAPKETV